MKLRKCRKALLESIEFIIGRDLITVETFPIHPHKIHTIHTSAEKAHNHANVCL